MTPPQSPVAVANYFIRKAAQENKPLTPMKLIKLVYISHGWYLALAGKPLIRESVQAWKYGPVLASLYHRFKQYGNRPLPTSADTGEEIIDNEYQDVKRLLDKVWESYSKFTPAQLSTITHQSDTPWSQVYDEHQRHLIIPDELIRQHYEGKIDARKRPQAPASAPADAAAAA